MSEKLIAGVFTALAVAPLCAVCVLGPAFIAASFAGAIAWLGNLDMITTTILIFVSGLAAFGVVRRGIQNAKNKPTREVGS